MELLRAAEDYASGLRVSLKIFRQSIVIFEHQSAICLNILAIYIHFSVFFVVLYTTVRLYVLTIYAMLEHID